VHISVSSESISLIWVSLERSFPSAELEYRQCQFWSKMMTSQLEERPTLVMASYGQNGSQWVKQFARNKVCAIRLKLSRHLKSYPKSSSGDLYHRVAT